MITEEIVWQVLQSSALFVIFWLIMDRGFFRPFLGVIVERERRTEGAQEKAKELRQQARAISADVEKELAIARREGFSLRDQSIDSAKKHAEEMISRASEVSRKELSRAREQIAIMKRDAEAEIPAEAEKLARHMAEQVLKTRLEEAYRE